MTSKLILIANAGEALLFRRGAAAQPLELLATFEHAPSRYKGSALGDERAGHASADQRPGGVSFAPRIGAKRKEHLRFADELAGRLDGAIAAHPGEPLVLFASSPFLGELKARLGPATTRALRAAIDVDLSSFSNGELVRRIDTAFQALRGSAGPD